MQSRYRCPACQHRNKTLTLYINTQTNEPLASHVGKCDRQDKCGYHYTPRMWFADDKLSVASCLFSVTRKTELTTDNQQLTTANQQLTTPFKQSLKCYHRNHLITWLTHTLGADVTQTLVERYRIGTAKHWPGATVFWQVDARQQVRAGKVMLYNPQTGKRVKQPYNHIAWAHKLLPVVGCELPVNPNTHATHNTQPTTENKPATHYKLRQCLFGEHLLAGNTLPVAIVESEKTALIASALLPGPVWLASGGIGNLNADNFKALRGREVTLFPDVNGYDAWQTAAQKLMHITSISVSDMLERCASPEMRSQGYDLADCLLDAYCFAGWNFRL